MKLISLKTRVVVLPGLATIDDIYGITRNGSHLAVIMQGDGSGDEVPPYGSDGLSRMCSRFRHRSQCKSVGRRIFSRTR